MPKKYNQKKSNPSHFKPGVSGNPNGKPKGSCDFRTLVKCSLDAMAEAGELYDSKTYSAGKQKQIIAYLLNVAKTDHKAFLSFLGRIMPKETHIYEEKSTFSELLAELKNHIIDGGNK